MKLRPPGSEQEKYECCEQVADTSELVKKSYLGTLPASWIFRTSADLDALIIDNGSETLKINTMATTGDREQCFEKGFVERLIFATPAYESGQLRFNLESADGCRKNFHSYRDSNCLRKLPVNPSHRSV